VDDGDEEADDEEAHRQEADDEETHDEETHDPEEDNEEAQEDRAGFRGECASNRTTAGYQHEAGAGHPGGGDAAGKPGGEAEEPQAEAGEGQAARALAWREAA